MQLEKNIKQLYSKRITTRDKVFRPGFTQINADTYFTKKKNLRESAKIRGKKVFVVFSLC